MPAGRIAISQSLGVIMWHWILAVPTFGAVVLMSVQQPVLLVAGLGGVIAIIYSYFLFPKGKIVGGMAAIALAMVILAPIHLVPSAFRFVELGVLALFTIITLLHRGFRMGGWIPALLLGYLAVTWLSTDAADIEGADFQFAMHAITTLAFLVMGTKANDGERRTIIKTIIRLGAGEAVYALYEYVTQPTVLWASPVPEAWAWMNSRMANEILLGGLRSQGTFGHPLLLSFVLIVAMGLALRYPFKRPLMRLALAGLFIAGAIAAGSRSATVIMVALALFTYGMSKLAWVRGLLIGAGGVLVAVTGSFMASDVVQRFTESGSLTHRQGAVDAVPRLLSEQTSFQVLVGNGWYSTQAVFDRGLLQLDGFIAIDNQFVATLVTSGLVGLVIVVALIFVCLKRASRDIRPALLGSMFVFLVFDVLEFPGTWGVMTIIMGLATMGVAIRMDPIQEAERIKDRALRLPEWAAKNPDVGRRSAE